jgi:hypothetical protein
MMRPVLRSALSPDVEDLDEFSPPVDQPWSVFVQLLIGPSEGQGEESFGLTICSGAWLDRRAEASGPQLGRHCLVMSAFEWRTARVFVEDYLTRCLGDSWQDVASRVSRLGSWEFEDYES